MSYVESYWDPDESQSFLGDFDGTVIGSFWSTIRIQSEGKVDGQGADDVQLYWLVRVDEVYQPYDKAIPESIQVNFGIGKKWQADEAGEWIEHDDDPPQNLLESGKSKPVTFGGGSLYGKFLGLCSGHYDSYYTETKVDPMVDTPRVLDDGDSVVYDLSAVRGLMSQRRANPRQASTWLGMRFRFRGLGFYYKQTKGTPNMKVVPVAFLGTDDGVSTDQGRNAVPSASNAAPVSTDLTLVAGTLPGDTPGDLVPSIGKLVDTSASHTEFMRNALQIPEVKSSPEIKAAVMSEGEGPWSVKGRSLEAEEAAAEESAEEPVS